MLTDCSSPLTLSIRVNHDEIRRTPIFRFYYEKSENIYIYISVYECLDLAL